MFRKVHWHRIVCVVVCIISYQLIMCTQSIKKINLIGHCWWYIISQMQRFVCGHKLYHNNSQNLDVWNELRGNCCVISNSFVFDCYHLCNLWAQKPPAQRPISGNSHCWQDGPDKIMSPESTMSPESVMVSADMIMSPKTRCHQITPEISPEDPL